VISTSSKTVTGSYVEGGTVTYADTLSKTASFDQQNNPGFELTDTLPSQLTLVSAADGASPGIFSNAGNTVNWDGPIPAGGGVTITITATVNAGTALQTVSNQGTVNHDNNGDGTNEAADLTDDPGQGGAADPTNFVVLSPASIGTHSKTVGGNFQEGGSITYTVTISNPSPNAQLDNPGDEFVDVLPASLTLVSATASSGVANADTGTNTVTWNGTLAPNGGSVTITIDAVINNGTGGQTIAHQGTIRFDADERIGDPHRRSGAGRSGRSDRLRGARPGRDSGAVDVRPRGAGPAAGERRVGGPAPPAGLAGSRNLAGFVRAGRNPRPFSMRPTRGSRWGAAAP
jgi:uncharacterized repeat protein (TIGR01451 family)